MCGKLLFPSPSGRYLVKLAMLLVFCCFAESAAGSCIRYGHSCWGAHGKRGFQGGPSPLRNKLSNINIKDNALIGDVPSDTNLFLTRLLQSGDYRPFKGRDIFQELKQFQGNDEETPTEDIMKNIEDLSSMSESEDVLPSIPNEKLRLIKYLKNIKTN